MIDNIELDYDYKGNSNQISAGMLLKIIKLDYLKDATIITKFSEFEVLRKTQPKTIILFTIVLTLAISEIQYL